LAIFIIFESFLIDSVEFYKNLTKDFSDIEKLWEVFDNAPKNVRYHQGKNFVFREGNFELQNISFTYNTQENMVFDDFSLSLV
jgi:ABC-type transport system involved in cytochrome bd biosynthesis fused ATPase/permease subunit